MGGARAYKQHEALVLATVVGEAEEVVLAFVLLNDFRAEGVSEIDEADHLVDDEQGRADASEPCEPGEKVVGREEARDDDPSETKALAEPEAAVHGRGEARLCAGEQQHHEEEARERECQAVDGPHALAARGIAHIVGEVVAVVGRYSRLDDNARDNNGGLGGGWDADRGRRRRHANLVADVQVLARVLE